MTTCNCKSIDDGLRPRVGKIMENWDAYKEIINACCKPKDSCQVLDELEQVRKKYNIGIRPWWKLLMESLLFHDSLHIDEELSEPNPIIHHKVWGW